MTCTDQPLSRRSLVGLGAVLILAACEREPAREDVQEAAAPMPEPAPTGPVVTMLGDSITAGLGLPAAEALPAQLESALAAVGRPARVRAAGVSGDTTAGGLARIDFSVQDDTTLCILALGGNDMLQGVEPGEVRANLSAILQRLKARKIPVLLAGMRAPPQYGRYAAEFDAVYADLARESGTPLYPFLLDGVALDAKLNQADGIHPNPAGVKVVAARLAPVVAEQLARLTS